MSNPTVLVRRVLTCVFAVALTASLAIAAPQGPAGAAAQAEPRASLSLGRVEQRTYFFEEAKKSMEYALYVPKNYDSDQATPLVVLLHGLGSNPSQVIGYQGVTTEAEKRGYIVVAPYGYNSRGWYGSRGNGKDGPYFGTKNDPDNLGELSQKDVMNVLAIVQREFNIDAARIYLMGHSMGGAGTVHLAMTFPGIWAALAPLAPALDGKTERLALMKHIPIKVVMGDKDNLVSVQVVRRWVAAMQKLGIDHSYDEIAGGDHVVSISRNPKMIATVFDFFDEKRKRPAAAEPAGDAAKRAASEPKGSDR